MLVLDTNVLVRLFAGDDREQMRRAVRLIEEAGKRAEPLLVPDLVFAETLWFWVRPTAGQGTDGEGGRSPPGRQPFRL